MKDHLTILNDSEAELDISKSRFIGYATPIKNEEEALSFIEKIKKKHWNATHNVPVYVVGESYGIQRYSDDGEPSGTAGVPILEMLKKEGITNICIVVTRYFGGIKLGTGGLVRAYTKAAKEAVSAAEVVLKKQSVLLSVTFDYHHHGKIQNHIMNDATILIRETIFTDQVTMMLYVGPEVKDEVTRQLIEMTSGQVEIEVQDEHYLTVREGEVLSAESLKGEIIWTHS